MRRTFLILAVLCCHFFLFGQKKLMDFSVAEKWPKISPQQISNDGKYMLYTIGASGTTTSLMVQATDGSWKREIPGCVKGSFTEDSHRLIFELSTDSIGVLGLAKDTLYYIDGIASFSTPKEGNGQWLAYLLKGSGKKLILRNLFTGEESSYTGVTESKFSGDGKYLALQTEDSLGRGYSDTLFWLDLIDKKKRVIGRGYQATGLVFDKTGEQFAFLAKDEVEGHKILSLRYYRSGMDSSYLLAGPGTLGMEGESASDFRRIFFSPSSNRIFFYAESIHRELISPAKEGVQVDIRNYLDDRRRNEILGKSDPYLAVVDTNRGSSVILLQKEGDTYQLFDDFCRDDYVLLQKDVLDLSGIDSNKISGLFHDIYLVSCKDGSRSLINKRTTTANMGFSPTGKFVYWYDEVKNHWYTYSIDLSATRNITAGINVPLSEESDKPNQTSGSFPLIGWLENDKAVFVQDRHDAWQVDPEGVRSPINLTHGYGQKHHIQFQYLDFNEHRCVPIHRGDTLLFSAFDQLTKMNGFFRVILGREENPEKLIMEPMMYFHLLSKAVSSGTCDPLFPIKAKFVSVYAVERMSAAEYPNLYVSTDLKEFRALSHLEPQKEYNWFTTELHHWKLSDGKDATGILYKPDNFNPNKRYPLILFIYERNSDALNYFIHPELSYGAINIPLFVSNGYLVFTPDIYYMPGYPGQSAYNSVVSAVLYLSGMPYVDRRHIGLQGHSFGAFEINYIISRSHLFAAAAPSAGMSDLISGSASLRNKDYYESGQGRLGKTMWERPDLYVQNSPIFKIGNVTTPVLIMHNKMDANVPFDQAEEWYYGLVRLGKRAWMLSYDKERHHLENDRNKLDYTIRLTQFFDHYLKGLKAPKWMAVGIDPHLKGLDNGLNINNNGMTQ